MVTCDVNHWFFIHEKVTKSICKTRCKAWVIFCFRKMVSSIQGTSLLSQIVAETNGVNSAMSAGFQWRPLYWFQNTRNKMFWLVLLSANSGDLWCRSYAILQTYPLVHLVRCLKAATLLLLTWDPPNGRVWFWVWFWVYLWLVQLCTRALNIGHTGPEPPSNFSWHQSITEIYRGSYLLY